MKQKDVLTIWELLKGRREAHQKALWQEVERLTAAASELGVRLIGEVCHFVDFLTFLAGDCPSRSMHEPSPTVACIVTTT
jgi:hypothetical protein